MSLITPTPGTMLGLAARDNRRAQKKATKPRSSVHARFRTVARGLLAALAIAIGLTGFSMSSAQAWPWDDMKDNITATIFNMCGPNDVPNQATYTNIDTIAGLNQAEPRDGYRSTIKPDFSKDGGGTEGGNGMERLQKVYGEKGDVIAKPTYERYGFSTLQWHQYGYDCFSPTLMMGPLANMALMSMVHVPMMISMAFLNFVMDNVLYTGFSVLMQPFIGAMYEIFQPWIYFLVPIGIGVTWLGSRGSLQATMKATGWGVLILSVYLLMGSSTSKVVSWATNIVTEVSGSAACKMNAAANGGQADNGQCDSDDPVKAVQQALWYGIPYQTWHLGQVGEYQAELDAEALEKGEVGWGPALLNGQYVGVDDQGAIDETGRKVLSETERWNRANYTPDSDGGKVAGWTEKSAWDKVPFLGNVKIMCNDVGEAGNEDRDPSEKTRWMYSGNDGTSNYCDSAGAGTSAMIPHIQGDEYNKQILIAMSGLVGVIAVALTILVAAVYLGFQKMMFFFLLFLAPLVLLVSAIGDRKRRPFAIRYAEIIGANLLKQVAAVCIVLFVSYAMASLFGSTTFADIPWIMKPYAALLFFVALAFLAFPLKNMVKGAIQGDTSVVDKQATAPQRAAKTAGKVAAVTAAVAATGGAAAALGAGGAGAGALASAGGKGAAMGKAGSMLGQAGRVMGVGSKSGRAMRAGGQLLKAGQGMMNSKDTQEGRKAALTKQAQSLLSGDKTRAKYRDKDGKLLPEAQKMAMKDAQKMTEKGQKTDRAAQAQDAHMKAFFNGYRADNGEFHKEDPQSPANQRKERERKERERRDAKSDADRDETKTGSAGSAGSGPRNANTSASAGAPGSGGGSNSTGKPNAADAPGADAPRADASQGQSAAQNYARYAEQAKENLSGPAFSHEMEYKVNTVRSSDDVLNHAGLSKEQVVDNPTLLLSGDAYNGGSTTAMDPFHAATPALNELRFAGSSGNEDAIQSAVEKAANAISQNGVPNQIDGVHSIGDRAGSFESVQLLGAMPHLSTDSSWQDRAEAAHTMQAAQVAMPQDFAARDSVQSYTDALSNPGVDIASLTAMKESTMTDIANAMSSSMGAAGAAAMASGMVSSDEPAPVSYEAPSAAPEAPPTSAPETPTSPSEPNNSVSREDLREAVSDGLREARLEQDAADTSSVGRSDAPSSSEATPIRGDAPSSSSTSYSAPSPAPAEDDSVDEVNDSDALVYRPGHSRRKKKRSDFFDHSDDPEDGED